MNSNLKNIRGHTLIELLVVLIVIFVLSAVSIPLVSGFIEKGKVNELKAYLLEVASAQERYYTSKGYYAPKISDLSDHGFSSILKDEKTLGSNDKIHLYTGMILRQSIGSTYWVAGNYDINSNTTYNECWLYFGSVFELDQPDKFIHMYDSKKGKLIASKNCVNCPDTNVVCK